MTGAAPDARVVVVGAGPAGLAAAVAAAGVGASVVLIDAEGGPGGQFWRTPTASRPDRRLYHGLSAFQALTAALDRHRVDGRIRYLRGHEVWAAERTGDGFAVHTRPAATITGTTLILATGAYDLQLPFPGWDLPGVLTAGGAQSLVKGHGVVAGRRIVVAGTGPFLLPVAAGLATVGAAQGARVVGVFDAARLSAAKRLARTGFRLPGKATEAAGYLTQLARHRVPYRPGAAVIEAHGTDRLQTVTVAALDADGRAVPGTDRRLDVDILAVGWGFTARLVLPLALGCTVETGTDGARAVAVDDHQATSTPGVFVAGELTGIGGADLALLEGRIAGVSAAATTPPEVPARWLAERDRLAAFADALRTAYPVPAGWPDRLADVTVVCRCEEVDAGTLRTAVEQDGAADARSAKLLTRVGMGRCQGSVCEYAVSCLTAHWSGGPVDWRPATRSITTPVPLGLVADPDPDPGLGLGRPVQSRGGS